MGEFNPSQGVLGVSPWLLSAYPGMDPAYLSTISTPPEALSKFGGHSLGLGGEMLPAAPGLRVLELHRNPPE